MPRESAVLALEDGSLFEGSAFGAHGRAEGEVVFNTCQTGYQEILTDPSYHGQLVAMTFPHIGNTGVNPDDPESALPRAAGFIAREFARRPSNWRSTASLGDYLEEHGVVAIDGIDTRALTRTLREKGCLKGVIASGEALRALGDPVAAARAVPDLADLDPVREVTCRRRHEWHGDGPDRPRGAARFARTGPTIAVLDCGLKRNILRQLLARGARVIVFPATTPADELLDERPDGVFVTNGPGDPRQASYVVETVKSLLGRLPVQGICLGHQILALAAGASTYKLKFGHHGGNHPVLHEETGKIEITSQNHNYAVDAASAGEAGFVITHRNLFDGTVEGMEHPELGLFSVQYHPEAAPGPHDSVYLWDLYLDHLGGRVR